MYEYGKGVVQDHKEAVTWYGLAAAQGYAEAQYKLGVMYERGQGVPQDYKEAVKWYRLAAAQRHALAQWWLGLMYEYELLGVDRDYVRAHMWLNLSVANGYSDASQNRDVVAKKLNSSQIQQAQEMAQRCQASSYKKCD